MSRQSTAALAAERVWQLGYPLALLSTLAAPFKARYKPFVHGAFGIPKERDLALALKARRVEVSAGAVLIGGRLKSASRQHDFTGGLHVLPAGDWLIADVAGQQSRAAANLVMRVVEAQPARTAVWWELFEEDEELQALAVDLGFRWAFSKVMAGSEIKGVYLRAGDSGRTLPALAPYEAEALMLARRAVLDIRQLGLVREELTEYVSREEPWAQHYSSYNKRESWTAFCLRGFDATDPGFIIKPAEMSKGWKAAHPERLHAKPEWTSAARAFPVTMTLLEQIPGEKERARFMRLRRNGGELSRHADITDRDAGLADGKLARLHVPIWTHPEVQFRAWTHRGKLLTESMTAGDLWYLDQRKPHAVLNPSGLDRVHLVVDVHSSYTLRRWLRMVT